MPPVFYNSTAASRKTRANLPHWYQPGVVTFVTFRLADALPQIKLLQWCSERTAWLARHPLPHDTETAQAYHREFSARMERWLDQGQGSCLLEKGPCAQAVVNSLRFGVGKRYRLGPSVVAANHVHTLIAPIGDWTLSKIMQGLKSVSARDIHTLTGGSGQLWQKESFDHLVRSAESLDKFTEYILRHRGFFAAQDWE